MESSAHCDSRSMARTAKGIHASHTTLAVVLKGQLQFSTPIVMDSEIAPGHRTWHKETDKARRE
ncbi:Uncharacterized protein DAT39_010188 [Clarias magur]|uniref:Uncharacterized protein n=1 Tax=Clarias magur TaxID=1594786 RepID=A0A8J4U718_CLAMG|nr:Uncharacterized protein DAT39_010188 [Clarias magur]